MDKEELIKRTRDFALRVVRLTQALPNHDAAKIIGKQLLRCATSVGANYRSACHGKSRADFLAKIKICEEEADECEYWMELLVEGGILPEKKMESLRAEAHEIAAIFTAATRTMMREE